MRACVDLLVPPACPSCTAPALGLCGPCERQLGRRPELGCRRCGEAVAAAGVSCGGDHRELRNVARLISPWRFAGTGGALVRRFKLDGDAAAGLLMARAMADAWRAAAEPGWRRALVVPVPLHPARARERGFDHAAWLAQRLAARLRLRAAPGTLARTRATLPQGDPRVLSREGNVAGAFAMRRAEPVRGRAAVLVDDVFTSGATARECARLLREAGALEVAMLTACRS